LPGHVLKLAFTPDRALIAVVSNRVVLFSGCHFQDAQQIKEWTDEEYRVITIIPGTSRLVVYTARTLQLAEVKPSFNEIWSRPACVNNLYSSGRAAISPDYCQIAVPRDGSVELRDLANGETLNTLESPMPREQFLGVNLFWSADGRWVAETWHDWLNVWDVNSGRHVFHMNPAGRQWIIGALFHAATGRLAIATHFALHILEPESWQEIGTFRYSSWPVNVVAQDQSGVIAMGGDHGVVLCDRVW
jgi:hypothetical protein